MKVTVKTEWFDNLETYFKGQDIAIAMGLITQFAITQETPDLTSYSKRIQKFLPILLQAVLQAMLQAKKRQLAGSQGGKKSVLKKTEEKKKILLEANKEVSPLSPSDVSPHTPLLNSPYNPPEERNNRESNDSLVRELFPRDFCESILDMYNEICVSLPKAQKRYLDDSRKEKIKTKAKEFKKLGMDPTETFREIFTRMERSDFLAGRRSDFKANFGWVVDHKGNWKKILEGNYDNNRPNNAAGGWPGDGRAPISQPGYIEGSRLDITVIG